MLAVAVIRDLHEQDLPDQAAHEVTQELLTLWLKRYGVWKGWRDVAPETPSALPSGESDDTSDPLRLEAVGFLRVASALVHGVLSKVLHEEQPGAVLPRSPILPAAASTTSAADTTASPVAAVQTQSVTEKRHNPPYHKVSQLNVVASSIATLSVKRRPLSSMKKCMSRPKFQANARAEVALFRLSTLQMSS